ncbi:MAG: methyltransferase domain-containing protein [Labilithrix sp.]|nr:methyltransferase domain-containing protein [Labilithrix sp.]
MRRALLFAAGVSIVACSRDARSPDGERPAPPVATATSPEPRVSSDDAGSAEPPMERVPDIEYVPTPQNVVDKMLEVAKVKKGDVLYDLGCGDGRIVVTAAKRLGIKAYGFDLDPQRIKESRENAKRAGVEHLVTFEQKDIFDVDLSPATVVTLYLLPDLNVRLIPQLEKLKPGSRVVSHDFDMEGVTYERYWTVIARDHQTPRDREHYVYLWKTPLRKK